MKLPLSLARWTPKGMPVGYPEWATDYDFRIIDQAGSFLIVTLGLRKRGPVTFRTEFFVLEDGAIQSKISLHYIYPTHGTAESSHACLIQIGMLAETPDEVVVLSRMANAWIGGSRSEEPYADSTDSRPQV